jgi:hypothetical protein
VGVTLVVLLVQECAYGDFLTACLEFAGLGFTRIVNPEFRDQRFARVLGEALALFGRLGEGQTETIPMS